MPQLWSLEKNRSVLSWGLLQESFHFPYIKGQTSVGTSIWLAESRSYPCALVGTEVKKKVAGNSASKKAMFWYDCHIYDIVFYNKYLFHLHPHAGTESLKPLDFLSEDSNYKGIFRYVNKVTFRMPLTLEWRLVASWKPTRWLEGRNFQSRPLHFTFPTPWPLGREEGLEIEVNHQWPMMWSIMPM